VSYSRKKSSSPTRRKLSKSAEKPESGFLRSKVLDIITHPKQYNPEEHKGMLEDIEQYGSETCRGPIDPCFVGDGSYARAYKTCGKRDCYLLKIKKTKRTFDINEYKINEMAYRKLLAKKFTLIAQPKGVFGYAHDPLAFVYLFEEGSITLDKFLETYDFDESELKSILFQSALCLYSLQKGVPGFCHNDLHTDNILIVPQSKVFSYGSVKMRCKYTIRLIDFGQSTTVQHKTKLGHQLWEKTSGNTMVDFLRLCNWILLTLYKLIRFDTNLKIKSIITNFLALLSGYVSKDCIRNGGKARKASSKTGKYLSVPYLTLNRDGETYINSVYSSDQPNAMNLILKDKYFTGT
jgi:serine/threonine protein kinase